jgi:hypothetical protein
VRTRDLHVCASLDVDAGEQLRKEPGHPATELDEIVCDLHEADPAAHRGLRCLRSVPSAIPAGEEFTYRLVVDGEFLKTRLRFRGPVRIGGFPLAEGGGKVTGILWDRSQGAYEIHVTTETD